MYRAVLAALAALISLATWATATTWIVAQDGSGDFTAVQAGIDAAVDGDTVLVMPGIYEEYLEIDHKTIRLASAMGPSMTFLTGPLDEGVLHVWGGSSTIEGFRISGGCPTGGGGLIAGAPVHVKGNVFWMNSTWHPEWPYFGSAGAIYVLPTSGGAVIEDNVFSQNEAGVGGAIGIVLNGDESPAVIRRNLFVENIAYGCGSAIAVFGGRAVVHENTFITGDGGVGVTMAINPEAVSAASAEVTNNVFEGDASHVWCLVACPYSRVGGVVPQRAEGQVRRQNVFMCNAFETTGGLPSAIRLCEGYEQAQNYFLDVVFCDEAAGDFHLPADSPIAPGATPCGQIGAFGVGCGPLAVGADELRPPVRLRVLPNPSTGSAAVVLDLPSLSEVVLSVFDADGRLLATHPQGQVAAGRQVISWSATDAAGRRLPAGVYFVRLDAATSQATAKVLLVD